MNKEILELLKEVEEMCAKHKVFSNYYISVSSRGDYRLLNAFGIVQFYAYSEQDLIQKLKDYINENK